MVFQNAVVVYPPPQILQHFVVLLVDVPHGDEEACIKRNTTLTDTSDYSDKYLFDGAHVL